MERGCPHKGSCPWQPSMVEQYRGDEAVSLGVHSVDMADLTLLLDFRPSRKNTKQNESLGTIPGGSSILLNLNICTPDMDRHMLYLYIYIYMWHIYIYINTNLCIYIYTDIHHQESPGHVENKTFCGTFVPQTWCQRYTRSVSHCKAPSQGCSISGYQGCVGGRRAVKVYIKG